MEHPKIIVALLEHFILCEGTDYLGDKGSIEELTALTFNENLELTRLRDIARRNVGWIGYEPSKG